MFNTLAVLTGLAMVVAAFGFHAAARRIGQTRVLPGFVALAIVLGGAGFVMGGLFPMPDPRHGGFGVGFALHLAPVLLAAALWKRRSLRSLSVYLLITAVLMAILLGIMMGIGGLVTRANVGLFQRAYALCLLPWIGVAGLWLRRVRD